jgi:hypothetical protein
VNLFICYRNPACSVHCIDFCSRHNNYRILIYQNSSRFRARGSNSYQSLTQTTFVFVKARHSCPAAEITDMPLVYDILFCLSEVVRYKRHIDSSSLSNPFPKGDIRTHSFVNARKDGSRVISAHRSVADGGRWLPPAVHSSGISLLRNDQAARIQTHGRTQVSFYKRTAQSISADSSTSLSSRHSSQLAGGPRKTSLPEISLLHKCNRHRQLHIRSSICLCTPAYRSQTMAG